jgi:hypothetical protein
VRPLLALFLGTALALFYASLVPDDPLWFDEVFTANLTTFRAGPREVVRRLAEGDAHPPLHYLYTWACAKAAGLWGSALEGPPPNVERRLRACNLPPVALTGAAFGLLLPPPLSLLGGGLLLATGSYASKAVEARMYPLLGLFLLLATWAALRGRPWAFSTGALLALYTHYLALVFLAPLALHAAFRGFRRGGWKGLLPLSPLLLFLPWLPAFLEQVGRGTNAPFRGAPFLALYAYSDYGGHLVVSLLLLGLLLLGVWRARNEAKGAVLLGVAAFPVLWYLQAALGPNTVSERYFGAFAPAFLLAALLGAPREALRLALPGLALAALLGPLAVRADPPRFAEDYRAMSALLRAAERKGPLPVLGNEGGRLVALRYYHRSPSPFKLVEEEDLRDLPPRFAALVYGGTMATERGLLLLSLDAEARKRGYRRHLAPPLSPVVLVYYRR